MRHGITYFARLCVIATLTVGLLASFQALADSDPTTDGIAKVLPYSGTLTRNGAAYNGSVEMRLQLFDGTADTVGVWSEDQTVNVYEGRFTVLLGRTSDTSATALASVIRAGDDLVLSITLDPNGEALTLTNKQRLFPASAAVAAGTFTVNKRLTVEASTTVDGSDGAFIVRNADGTLLIDGDDLESDTTLGLNLASGAPVQMGGNVVADTFIGSGGFAMTKPGVTTVTGDLTVGAGFTASTSQLSAGRVLKTCNGSQSCTCDAGLQALGGGGVCTAGSMWLQASYPTGDDTWVVDCSNNSANTYVVCADID